MDWLCIKPDALAVQPHHPKNPELLFGSGYFHQTVVLRSPNGSPETSHCHRSEHIWSPLPTSVNIHGAAEEILEFHNKSVMQHTSLWLVRHKNKHKNRHETLEGLKNPLVATDVGMQSIFKKKEHTKESQICFNTSLRWKYNWAKRVHVPRPRWVI